jgi:hypothetical protein
VEAPVERVPGWHDRRRADPLPAPALTDIRPAQGRLDGPRLAGELTKDDIRSHRIQPPQVLVTVRDKPVSS